MAGHPLIDAHVAGLARRLPRAAVDELQDGLSETFDHHLATGLPADAAARAAVSEFGTVDEIVEAFVRQSPGRRAARGLLLTGPLVGACWATALITGRAWTWSLPSPARPVAAVTLLVVVALLLVAATSRRSYRRSRMGAAAGVGLMVVDAVAVTGVVLLGPAVTVPVLVALSASSVRIVLTARAVLTG